MSVCAAFLVIALSFVAGCGGGGEADKTSEAAAEKSEAAAEKAAPPAGEKEALPEGPEYIAELLDVDLSAKVEGEKGLSWIVREEGTGPVPQKGQRIRAHYTGYLMNGTKFDSSVDRGQPFETEIGIGRVIQGWDMAFTSMKVGEKRVLFIPAPLAYGPRGAGGVIPPNADLVFDVELIGIVQ
ncbi:MAG: FKBP-type peptidyl-prolyl cis-trans isomerase [Candidatus Eisenbacteria bacterium]|nr:FKBP-type peptidyl-prolyl cis-trans isomerase [Candidatus Eisenbacteria bacterium]